MGTLAQVGSSRESPSEAPTVGAPRLLLDDLLSFGAIPLGLLLVGPAASRRGPRMSPSRCRPRWRTETRAASDSLARWPLTVEGATPTRAARAPAGNGSHGSHHGITSMKGSTLIDAVSELAT